MDTTSLASACRQLAAGNTHIVTKCISKAYILLMVEKQSHEGVTLHSMREKVQSWGGGNIGEASDTYRVFRAPGILFQIEARNMVELGRNVAESEIWKFENYLREDVGDSRQLTPDGRQKNHQLEWSAGVRRQQGTGLRVDSLSYSGQWRSGQGIKYHVIVCRSFVSVWENATCCCGQNWLQPTEMTATYTHRHTHIEWITVL